MTTHFEYAGKTYTDRTLADAAIADFISALEEKPNRWCSVKIVSENKDGSFSVSVETLTDKEIVNLSNNFVYQFSCRITGNNVIGIPSSEVATLVEASRVAYIDWMRAWSLYEVKEIGVVDIGLRYSPQTDSIGVVT